MSSEADTVKISALAKFSSEHYTMIPLDISKGLVRLLFYDRQQSGRLHKHLTADEYFCILEGNGTITIGDGERLVGAGNLVKVPSGIPHQWKSGPERLVMLSVIVPTPSYQLADEATKSTQV